MKFIPRLLPCLLFAKLAQATPADPATNAQADSLLAFACDLYRPHAARTGPTENLAIAPINLAQIVELLATSTAGETKDQLDAALHHNGKHEAWAPTSLLPVPDPVSGMTLKQSTGIWLAPKFTIKQEAAAKFQQTFGSAIESMDFEQPTNATATINAWISKQTNEQIPNLLPPALITKQTRMVAASALFFQGQWETKFDPAQTKPGKFTTATGEKLSVPLMHGVYATRFAQWPDGTKVLALDFHGAPLSFWALLPSEGKGNLAALEAGLTPQLLRGLDRQLKRQPVTITLPKFTIRSEFPAQAMLKSLGVRELFDSADFTPITAESDLAVSALLHQVTFQCDESGAEAAAATAGIIVSKSANTGGPAVFTADQPFVFLIVENETLAPVVMGRCGKPKAVGGTDAPPKGATTGKPTGPAKKPARK